MRKGFTLIEMSVVLVIIGLLVGVVLISQSLIRSAKVQTIIQDVATYQSAVTQFKQKYNAMPGDMANATNYWGTNPNCTTDGGVGTGTQTCNGNGDGLVSASSSGPHENFLFWQHLANAGLIPGSYTGNSVTGTTNPGVHCSPGVNCPSGSVNPSQVYLIEYLTQSTSTYWLAPSAHYFIVSKAATGAYLYPILSGSEAYSLDAKVDDGLPGLGTWRTYDPTNTLGAAASCALKSTGSTVAPTDGTYASEVTAVYNTFQGNTPVCTPLIQMTN